MPQHEPGHKGEQAAKERVRRAIASGDPEEIALAKRALQRQQNIRGRGSGDTGDVMAGMRGQGARGERGHQPSETPAEARRRRERRSIRRGRP